MGCKSIFMTATGTDVGKTYISGLLVKKMREYNLNCGYYKPALSGAIKLADGTLLPGDCDYVVKTACIPVKPSDCVTYCFEEAVSPHLAAERLGINIEKNVIKSEFEKRCENYDYLVVEGAGGITCPFNMATEQLLLLPEVIKELGTDVLLVADGGLGTINSVLLTAEYAKVRGLNILGIILNNYDETDFMHLDNKKQIEVLTGINVIATVAKNDKNIDITKENLIKLFTSKAG